MEPIPLPHDARYLEKLTKDASGWLRNASASCECTRDVAFQALTHSSMMLQGLGRAIDAQEEYNFPAERIPELRQTIHNLQRTIEGVDHSTHNLRLSAQALELALEQYELDNTPDYTTYFE